MYLTDSGTADYKASGEECFAGPPGGELKCRLYLRKDNQGSVPEDGRGYQHLPGATDCVNIQLIP